MHSLLLMEPARGAEPVLSLLSEQAALGVLAIRLENYCENNTGKDYAGRRLSRAAHGQPKLPVGISQSKEPGGGRVLTVGFGSADALRCMVCRRLWRLAALAENHCCGHAT